MPLPVVGDVMTAPMPNGIPNAPLVTNPFNKGSHTGKNGTAAWNGNTLQFTAPQGNYWYLPQALGNSINWCIIPAGAVEAYVVSDNFGGCELHVLHHAGNNRYAVMHVARGGGTTTPYITHPGWALVHIKRSQAIALAGGVYGGSNWSVTSIDFAQAPVVVDTKFIRINGTMTVTHENHGDTPYAPPVAPQGGFRRFVNVLFGCFRR